MIKLMEMIKEQKKKIKLDEKRQLTWKQILDPYNSIAMMYSQKWTFRYRIKNFTEQMIKDLSIYSKKKGYKVQSESGYVYSYENYDEGHIWRYESNGDLYYNREFKPIVSNIYKKFK